jgi:sortase A
MTAGNPTLRDLSNAVTETDDDPSSADPRPTGISTASPGAVSTPGDHLVLPPPPRATHAATAPPTSSAGATSTPVPAASDAPVRPRASTATTVGRVLTGLGVLCLAFVVFSLWVTDLQQVRAQDRLSGEFEKRFVTAVGLATGGSESGGEFGSGTLEFGGEAPRMPDLQGQTPEAVTTQIAELGAFSGTEVQIEQVTEPSRDVLPGLIVRTIPDAGTEFIDIDRVTLVIAKLAPGTPVASLEIPAIALQQTVVEGTGVEQLMEGPGHLRPTPLPGEAGNAVLLGHRTTYASPFKHLGELVAGDEIRVVTTAGAFRYTVTETKVVGADDPDVLGGDPEGRNLLTLVTSNPEFRADERLAVIAELEGRPVATTDKASRQVALDDDELGRTGDRSAWGGVLLWGEVLVAAVVTAALLYQRWRRWPTWLLTTPIILASGYLFFTSVQRLLPSTI